MSDVYIVNAKRTPISRLQTDLKDVEAPFLALPLLRYLLDIYGENSDLVQDIVLSTMGESSSYTPMARYLALEAGMNPSIKSMTLNGGHLGGAQSVMAGFQKIKCGESQKVLSIATDSASSMPYLISSEISDLFFDLLREKGLKDKILILTKLNLKKLTPLSTFKKGLEDSFLHKRMSEVLENLAEEMMISRAEQDQFAHESHVKSFRYQKQNGFDDEIIPITCGASRERILAKDLGPRGESSLNTLESIKPFTKKGALTSALLKNGNEGMITKGNTSFLADAAAMVYLVSEKELIKNDLKPLAKIVDVKSCNFDPKWGSAGAVFSLTNLMENNNLTYDDLSVMEFNEDYAASVLIQKKILQSIDKSKEMGIPFIKGTFDDSKINPVGGAISLGHPFGVSGMRMVVSLSHYLRRTQGRFGTVTIGGTMGESISILIENVNL